MLNAEATALWVSSFQLYSKTEENILAWECALFRNESESLSSEMIVSAVAATRHVWGEIPERGFLTFVNAGKVKRKRDPGRCFIKAGWIRGKESKNGLVRLVLPPDRFPDAMPPCGLQEVMFGRGNFQVNKVRQPEDAAQ